MKESKRFTLNSFDFKRSFKNALIFATPALLVLFADVTKSLPEWFEGPWLLVLLWLVNWLTDLLRKFLQGR